MIDTHCHFLQALTSHRPQALKYYPGGGYKGLRNTCLHCSEAYLERAPLGLQLISIAHSQSRT